MYKAPALYSPAPVFSWTGFYIGAHGGYGWSNFSGDDPTTGGTDTAQARGWLGGVTVGYNYQINSFVVGVEGDYSWADVNKTDSDPLGLGGGEAKLKNDFFATAAVRLGYAVDRFLLYGKGGVAFWNNWSAKLEYNYLHFKSIEENLTTGGGLTATPANISLNSYLLKLGVNYRFH